MIRRALISVYDKTGILEVAEALKKRDVEILSTGGTAELLRKNGIQVTDVSDFTGFPEMLGGRVKTMHPKICGGVLAMRDNPEHQKDCEENGILPIDLVIVNLYPFEATMQKEGVTFEEVVEQIDIGGPTLLRSAAKNHKDVTVIVDPVDYGLLIDMIEETGDTEAEFKYQMAAKVFMITSRYDSLISNFFYPDFATIYLQKVSDLRYGENPHQKAYFYKEPGNEYPNIANATKHQGKELSYNNILDADTAFNLITEFDEPAVAIIKHAIPCGVAVGESVFEAYTKAYESDTKSPFGGIVAMNRECDGAMARKLNEIFLEIVIAPSFTDEALEIFEEKPNLRVLETGSTAQEPDELVFRKVSGGFLVQDKNRGVVKMEDLKQITTAGASEEQKQDMLFAWKVIKHVRSNAIVVVKNGVTLGIGAGQTARVDAVEIACKKAGEGSKGAVLASDAFFPFPDGVETAGQYGITAIVHPGGSIRDKEVEAKANELGIAMMYCGQRAFLH